MLPKELFSNQRQLYPDLPATSSLRIILSTFPDEDLQEKLRNDDLLCSDPLIHQFHPTVLFICRKSGRSRLYDKEPVPNYQMFQQELLVENGIVKIVNKKSEYDAVRSKVLPVDTLFTMDENNVINLGDGDKMLNILVLKNNTDARSGADNEEHLTLKKMIEGRVPGDIEKQNKLAEYFSSKKEEIDNRFQLRIKVEVFDLNYKLLASGISEKIVNTESNRIGAFKFFDVFPQQSCTEGGKKIVMISEFPLNTDTEPQFQLWDQLGERVDEEIERQILKQAKPNEVSKVQNTIIFISPPQPNYLQIVEQSYKVKLVAVRKSDKMESNSFDFVYEDHMSKYTFNPKDLDKTEIVQFHCSFCDDHNATEISLPKLDTAKPNHKRKFFSAEQISKVRRVSKATGDSPRSSKDSPRSTASDSGLDLSPVMPEMNNSDFLQNLGFNKDFAQELETLQPQGASLEEYVLRENGIEPDSSNIEISRVCVVRSWECPPSVHDNELVADALHDRDKYNQSLLTRIISCWQIIPLLFLVCVILLIICPDIVMNPDLMIAVLIVMISVCVAYVAFYT